MKKDYFIQHTYDLPIQYKGINIYPTTMKMYYQFHTFIQCLMHDKNSIPDVNIIMMTYLEYLIKTSNNENNNVPYLIGLFEIITNGEFPIKDILYVDGKPSLVITDKIIINSDELDEIREIVCQQNLIDIPDYTIQKEIRDKMDEALRMKSKSAGVKYASLEDQMIALSIVNGISLSDIEKMTIRKFIKYMDRIDAKMHYEIFLQASLSGMVTFKDKSVVRHWLMDKDKNKYEDVKIDMRKLKTDNNGLRDVKDIGKKKPKPKPKNQVKK